MEENGLFTDSVFSNTIAVGRIIAIYSSPCKVLVNITQMSTFLMIMIIFQQAMITWSSIILKRHLKTFDKGMFNTNRSKSRKYM